MARPVGTKNIETPEKMWELFLQYSEYVKKNPFLVTDWVGAKAVEVVRAKEKPLTVEGFEVWCFKNGIISDLSHYFCNLDGRYADFVAICSRIRKTVRIDQIEGGMSGMYNPSITQRLNGLVEKTESEVRATLTNVTPTVINTQIPIATKESDVKE